MHRGLLLPGLLLLSTNCLAAAPPASPPISAPTWPPLIADPVALLPWPENGSQARASLRAAIQSNDRERAAAAARALAAMGGGLTEASQALIAPLLDPALAAELRAGFAANAAPLSASSVETAIPVEHHLIEGIAWDSAGGRLFAGSVADRRLLVREGREWRAVPLPADVGGVFGIAIDPARRILWLASSVADPVPNPQTVFRGLIGLDLATLGVVRRVALPADAAPGDLAIAPDGTLYASDGASGLVYSAPPGAERMEILFGPGRMRSAQGLVVSADGARIYVADYGLGMGVYDLASRRLYRLRAADPAMLDGIDGLIAWRGDLIAIQNGASPVRILRLRLAPDGLSLSAVDVLERRNPEWGEPTLGTIAGDRLLYVGDGQWDRYGPGGTVTGEGPTRPTPIRALPLSY